MKEIAVLLKKLSITLPGAFMIINVIKPHITVIIRK